ncbi:hypothetical protein BHYA_1293g00010 [Botrytis hyacinthi]|uniref:Uncharacterized protein n=1 Tax=Botrytis hyacinthi TaxID=278943 RepID=A0A4Z1G2X0_9HELO|nr:hypothetical protein BHYA_1293g00010 [Botrytis hyacinthi]
MTFITPPFESQSILTQDDREKMKAARERFPHVLSLFALWEYVPEEWALDSWTKPNS